MTSIDHRWIRAASYASQNQLRGAINGRSSGRVLVCVCSFLLMAVVIATSDAKTIFPSALQRNGDVEYFGKSSATKMTSSGSRRNNSSPEDSTRSSKSKRPLPVRSAPSHGVISDSDASAATSNDVSPWTGRNPMPGTGGWKGDPTIQRPSDAKMVAIDAIDHSGQPYMYAQEQYSEYEGPGGYGSTSNSVRSPATWYDQGPHLRDRRPVTSPMGKSYSGGTAPATATVLDGSALYPPSTSGAVAYPPSTSGGIAYPPSTSVGMAYAPMISGGMTYQPSASGGISYAPSTSGGMAYPPSTSGVSYAPSTSGGVPLSSGTSGGASYSPGQYEASPSYNYGSMYPGGVPLSGGGGGPYGGAMPYPPASSAYGAGAPMTASMPAYPPYGTPPATNAKEDLGFRSFVSKLLALLPLGLLLAVALPNLVFIPNNSRSLSEDAGESLSSKMHAETFPIFDLIGYHGVGSAQDRSCFDHIVCRTVRLGSRKGANTFQKDLWTLVNRLNDDWAKSVDKLDLWKAIKSDQCSTFTCMKKDSVLLQKDR